jgi:acetyl esterase/lipase
MPLHPYPAANNDITQVYKALLETYEANHIGLYGSEAGGILAAQAMAHFKQAQLPLPGALGLCGAGAMPSIGGDSVKINGAVTGYSPGQYAYFADADPSDPLVCPLQSDEVLASFPPTLLFSQVRDLGLSSVVYTHQQLVRVGVEADLHVWEGPGGWHLYHPPLAESAEAFRVMARFFDKHLAN